MPEPTCYTCYLTPDDATLLRAVGLHEAREGCVDFTLDLLNEVLYLLDRAAEAGNDAACRLAGILLATCEVRHG